MNNYMIRELEDFLAAARQGEITSCVIAASMVDGRSLAAWEVHDQEIIDSLEFVRKCAVTGVLDSEVYEKDTAEGHQETTIEAVQENV